MLNAIIKSKNLSNWFIRLNLLWAVFIFSGYVANDFFDLPKTTQTELVDKHNTVSNPTISFRKATTRLQSIKPFEKFLFCRTETLLAFNCILRVKFNALKKNNNSYHSLAVHLPNKTIPQDSKDAFPTFLFG